jgi:hypothetical protein
MGQNIKESLENWHFLELLMDFIAEICEVKIEAWLWLSNFRGLNIKMYTNWYSFNYII